MDWSKVKPTDIATIHMRFEGETNTNWKVKLKDGTEQAFYGYESGPHYETAGPKADYSLWDDNAALYDWLCELHFKLDIPHWNPTEDAVDFDLSITSLNGHLIGEVSNIVVQCCDDGKYDRYVNYPNKPNFYLD